MLPGETTFKIDEPVEVSAVATGLMLIRRNVFELLEPFCDKYALNGSDASFDMDQMVTEFFDTSIEGGILYSEDYHFCRLYRKHGGKVYAAPWVNVVHAGEYTFSGKFAAFAQFNTKKMSQEDSLQSLDTTDDHSE
jgi:GT2 family glycosyltransferase